MQKHFKENIDKTVNFLQNWETSLKPVEAEQSNIFGEILALMHHQEDRNSIAPLLLDKEEKSRFPVFEWNSSSSNNWIMKITALILIWLLTLIGCLIYCKRKSSANAPNITIPLVTAPNPPIPLTVINHPEPKSERLRTKDRKHKDDKNTHKAHASFDIYFDNKSGKLRYKGCKCEVSSDSD